MIDHLRKQQQHFFVGVSISPFPARIAKLSGSKVTLKLQPFVLGTVFPANSFSYLMHTAYTCHLTRLPSSTRSSRMSRRKRLPKPSQESHKEFDRFVCSTQASTHTHTCAHTQTHTHTHRHTQTHTDTHRHTQTHTDTHRHTHTHKHTHTY